MLDTLDRKGFLPMVLTALLGCGADDGLRGPAADRADAECQAVSVDECEARAGCFLVLVTALVSTPDGWCLPEGAVPTCRAVTADCHEDGSPSAFCDRHSNAFWSSQSCYRPGTDGCFVYTPAPSSVEPCEPEDGPAGPDEDRSCGARSDAACEADGECMLATARRIVSRDGAFCVSDETLRECRKLGYNCSDGDAPTVTCDREGTPWWSAQYCKMSGHQNCADESIDRNAVRPCDE